MWSSGHDAEDNLGQRIMIASSDDGLKWSEPAILVDTIMGDNSEMVCYALGFYSNGETLVAYYHSYEYKESSLQNNGTFRPEGSGHNTNDGNYLIYSNDGINWSEPVSINYTNSLAAAPEKTADGKLITMGATNFIYTYDLSGITGWTAGVMPKDLTKEIISNGTVKTFTEGNIYELLDGTLRVVYRTNTDYLWCAKSTDGGLTWTVPYKTNMTDDHSKVNMGTLPDGRYYYVGNPIRGGDRLPLMLSVSEDGDSFDTHYILRNEPYTIKSSGLYKGGNYAYPSVCFDDEYMYIIYSKGKEVIEVTKISLDDI